MSADRDAVWVLGMSKRIEILGVPGAGKSTLAGKFICGGIQVLAERHQDNPFWGNHSLNERLGFLGYDLTFLLQHTQLTVGGDPSKRKPLSVCDWSFLSDRLWASMRLASDLPLYQSVYDALMGRIPAPIGYLYLKQPADTIVQRVLARGRQPELAFIDAIQSAVLKLDEVVKDVDPAKVMIVGDEFDVEQLLGAVKRWSGT
jgi:deoxyadenosine/deoxycytidine kinase